ncbi:unnamed protein product [Paramecium sonneborni]|uniref:Uncharacterized protein n=1 Tax=Paramecium sonneborni TaxID=65129 RepID=A0A8S1QM51_9CILI|nr:unnamed protein product [Paramecium sonneborni]
MKIQNWGIFEFQKQMICQFNRLSGQKISLYQKFQKINRTYSLSNQKFCLIALSKDQSIIKNLNNSFCYIDSRILNISEYDDEKYEFSQDFTNIDVVNFNEQIQDYNLDDLIVYFDNELPSEIELQLKFRCNSIFVPNYNELYPYNLQSTHSNYKLRINIKTLLCQYGEIKNYTDFSCIPCDNNQIFSHQLLINKNVNQKMMFLLLVSNQLYQSQNQVIGDHILKVIQQLIVQNYLKIVSVVGQRVMNLVFQVILEHYVNNVIYIIQEVMDNFLLVRNSHVDYAQKIITLVSIQTLASILISVQITLIATKEYQKFLLIQYGISSILKQKLINNFNQNAHQLFLNNWFHCYILIKAN